MSVSAKKFFWVFNLFVTILLLLLPATVVAALGVVSVAPNLVINDVANTISIAGSEFEAGSVVSLDGYGPLSTAYVSPTTLSAIVPNGISAGVYTVTVTNSDTSSAYLPNGLTVTEPVATSNPESFGRPQLIVKSYKANVRAIQFGQEFNLNVTVHNSGQLPASNVQASFTTGDLIPRQTGGVVAVGLIGADNKASFSQPMTAATNLWGKSMVSVDMTLSYYDEAGTAYSEKFTLVLPLSQPEYVAPTSTPAPSAKRPQ
ncbi:MAG: hypothetical protein R3309_14840, partial [Reinekea sp.]|nr:hypothetical protein [Reinekea sp.]